MGKTCRKDSQQRRKLDTSHQKEATEHTLRTTLSVDVGHVRKQPRNSQAKVVKGMAPQPPECIRGGSQHTISVAEGKGGRPQASRALLRIRNTRDCPPRGTAREIVMVGDKNAGLLAEAMVSRTGSQSAVECIYGTNATLTNVVSCATEYAEKALPVPRKYTLHAGLHDVLKGNPEEVASILERRRSGRHGSLIVCSIPEIITRGGETCEAAVLANVKIKKWCRRTGNSFLDLGKAVLPVGFQRLNAFQRGHRAQHQPNHQQRSTAFLEQRDLPHPGKPSLPPMSHSMGWTQCERESEPEA